jgi:hypothetical protein
VSSTTWLVRARHRLPRAIIRDFGLRTEAVTGASWFVSRDDLPADTRAQTPGNVCNLHRIAAAEAGQALAIAVRQPTIGRPDKIYMSRAVGPYTCLLLHIGI